MNTEHRVTADIAKINKGVHIFDQTGQFDHRGMVLRVACELEYQVAEVLLAFMQSVNSNLSHSRAQKDLFSENGLLGSLTKSVRLAVHLGLLTEDTAHDLRQVANLRNRYAHSRIRDQFYRDPEAAAMVRSFKLYLNSMNELSAHDDQGIFLACTDQLAKFLAAKARELKAGDEG